MILLLAIWQKDGVNTVSYYERGVNVVINVKDLPKDDLKLSLEELAEKYSKTVQDIIKNDDTGAFL